VSVSAILSSAWQSYARYGQLSDRSFATGISGSGKHHQDSVLGCWTCWDNGRI
jgi:hypothetical protein